MNQLLEAFLSPLKYHHGACCLSPGGMGGVEVSCGWKSSLWRWGPSHTWEEVGSCLFALQRPCSARLPRGQPARSEPLLGLVLRLESRDSLVLFSLEASGKGSPLGEESPCSDSAHGGQDLRVDCVMCLGQGFSGTSWPRSSSAPGILGTLWCWIGGHRSNQWRPTTSEHLWSPSRDAGERGGQVSP